MDFLKFNEPHFFLSWTTRFDASINLFCLVIWTLEFLVLLSDLNFSLKNLIEIFVNFLDDWHVPKYVLDTSKNIKVFFFRTNSNQLSTKFLLYFSLSFVLWSILLSLWSFSSISIVSLWLWKYRFISPFFYNLWLLWLPILCV